MSPLVSIVIPVYNAASSIGRCLDSILSQEFRDFQVICVDDGSTDESPAILDGYAEKEPRIMAVHTKNGGVSKARNAALALVKGTYVQFVDSDDWLPPDSTKLLVQAARAQDADLVVADFWRVVQDRVSRKGDIEEEQTLSRAEYADFMKENPADFYYGALWNKLYRANLIGGYDIRMDETLPWCEDLVFNLEYVLCCKRIFILHAPVYYYMLNPKSIVSTINFSKMVRIKRDLIDYFSEFYLKLYDGNEKEARKARPNRYRLFFDLPDDAMAVAGAIGTKKLGKETVSALVDDDIEHNPYTLLYYAQKLITRYRKTLADRFSLEARDIQVLEYLMFAQSGTTVRQISDFTDLSQVTVLTSLQFMSLRKLVEPIKDKEKSGEYGLGPESEDVQKAIRQSMADFTGICLQGTTPADRAMLRNLENGTIVMLQKLLSPAVSD